MNQDPINEFKNEIIERAESYKNNKDLQESYSNFSKQIVGAKYAYNFLWMGVPIIQAPQDLQALQEIIWEVKPDLIIETGVAWGGSIVFSASMLSLLETCGEIDDGLVVGIDIEVRKHNKTRIEEHPMSKKIQIIEGSSIDESIIEQIKIIAQTKKRILVCLDSNHTHDHVLQELRAYAPLVSTGSYCMVGDTGIEDLDEAQLFGRPWGKKDNPKTAVHAYLKENSDFELDKVMDSKLILTSAPDGYLKKIK